MGALQSKHLPVISDGMAIDNGAGQMKKPSNQHQMREEGTPTK